MTFRTTLVGGRRSHHPRRGACVLVAASLTLASVLTACSLLPGPDPDPPTRVTTAPTTEFPPLADDATKGLDTGATDMITGLASTGSTVVAVGMVYGNRLAPVFRYSTDAGSTWQLGRLSAAAESATPPDQGDQTEAVAVTTVDGAARWVTLGTNWREPLTWTSADGRTWDRHAPPDDQIGETATVEDLVAVPGGFVLVGTDADDQATAWTSADGATWRPHRMGGKGSPAAVASKGGTVVAVGSREDSYATWLSTDRGQTWSRGTAPPKPADDGDFSRNLDDVTATEDGFTAIGSYSAEEWRPVTYTSGNGRSWTLQSSGNDLARVTSSGGALIRSAGARQAAVTQEWEPKEQPRLWVRRGRVWQTARTPLDADPSRLESGAWTVADLVRSAEAWIAAVSRSTNGQVVTELWRSTDSGQTYARVPRPDAALNQPVAHAYQVVRAGEETLVFGDSRRRPVVWTRAGTEPFGPARLISARGSDRLEGAASGPKGVLVFGNRSADGTAAAVVWTRQGDRWVDTAAGSFSAADRRYASSEIRSVAWLRNRWVAVGSTSDNGDLNRSALVATSTNGLTWRKGRAARTSIKAGGDVWYDVTDLQGDHDRTRAMHGVATVGRRLLAVGDASEGKERAAAVWTSDDARTWSLRRLPLDGLAWSSMAAVASRGSTVVAVGTGAASDDAPARLVSWQSGDGGRTWTRQLLGSELGTETPTLVALASGFALITDSVDRTGRPVLLLSDDGRRWRPHPVDAVPQQPGEGVGIAGALADGDDLWLLARTVNRAGAGTRLVIQPTR